MIWYPNVQASPYGCVDYCHNPLSKNMKQNTKTKEMFITRALEKILKDKDVRRKDNIELKKACEAALGEL